jgi:hypothetical protein
MANRGWLVGCLLPPPHSGVPLASYFLAPMQLSAYSEYIKKLPFVKMFSDIVSHSTASKILKHMLSLFVTFVVNGKKNIIELVIRKVSFIAHW